MVLDTTINLGSLVGAGALIVTMVTLWMRSRDTVRDNVQATDTLKTQVGELRDLMGKVSSEVSEIKIIQYRLSDGKERMDSLEIRVHDCEDKITKLQMQVQQLQPRA